MKSRVKIIIDIFMSVVLFILMSYQFTGEKNHEIAGTVMLILFLLHYVLNYKWYITLGKGKYSLQRWRLIITDGILLINMILLILSGIGMSRYVFSFLDFPVSTVLARNIHMITSHLGFLLMGIHIGQHFGMILSIIRKTFHIDSVSSIRRLGVRIISVIISGYGIYALIKRNFLLYITLKMQFVYFDYKETVLLYEIDLLAIMILAIFTGYYLQKLLINMRKRRIEKCNIYMKKILKKTTYLEKDRRM